MSEPEDCLRILKGTACRVGAHVFVWTANGTTETEPSDPDLLCDCELLTWRHAQNIQLEGA